MAWKILIKADLSLKYLSEIKLWVSSEKEWVAFEGFSRRHKILVCKDRYCAELNFQSFDGAVAATLHKAFSEKGKRSFLKRKNKEKTHKKITKKIMKTSFGKVRLFSLYAIKK